MKIDETYQRASEITGKPVPQLEAMAREVFASMLFHAMEQRERVVWTAAALSDGMFNVEVNVPPRKRAEAT